MIITDIIISTLPRISPWKMFIAVQKRKKKNTIPPNSATRAKDQKEPNFLIFPPANVIKVKKTNTDNPAAAEKIIGEMKSFDSSFLGLKRC